MALAMTEVSCTTPLSIFVIVLNATTTPIGPWRSWSDTHFDYSRVEQYPAVLWRSNYLLVVSLELSRWIAPVCALVFFAFFGFAQEARKNYRVGFDYVTRNLGLSSFLTQSSSMKKIGYVISYLMNISIQLTSPAFSHHLHPKPPNVESLGSFPVYVPASVVQQHQPTFSPYESSCPSYYGISPSSEPIVFDIKAPLSPTSPTSSAISYSQESNLESQIRDDRVSISCTQYSASEHALQAIEPFPPFPHLHSVVSRAPTK